MVVPLPRSHLLQRLLFFEVVGAPGVEPGSPGYKPGALTVELRAMDRSTARAATLRAVRPGRSERSQPPFPSGMGSGRQEAIEESSRRSLHGAVRAVDRGGHRTRPWGLPSEPPAPPPWGHPSSHGARRSRTGPPGLGTRARSTFRLRAVPIRFSGCCGLSPLGPGTGSGCRARAEGSRWSRAAISCRTRGRTPARWRAAWRRRLHLRGRRAGGSSTANRRSGPLFGDCRNRPTLISEAKKPIRIALVEIGQLDQIHDVWNTFTGLPLAKRVHVDAQILSYFLLRQTKPNSLRLYVQGHISTAL